MACGFTTNDVIGYMNNELSQKKRSAFQNHLADCDKCRTDLSRLTQIESAVEETTSPGHDIAGETISRIKREHIKTEPKKGWRVFLHPRKALVSALGFALMATLLVIFWQPVVSGISHLINSKYSAQIPGQPTNGVMPGGSTPDSYPAIAPEDTGKAGDTPRFAIYKASISLQDIYILYSGRDPALNYLPSPMPYDSIQIDQIPLDEKPLLTDADVETYYDGTLIFKDIDNKTYDYFLNNYMSVSPLPLVITVDGKRVAWGTYMHPISSMSPPLNAFLLSIRPGEQESDGCYFTLSADDMDRFKEVEALIRPVFSDIGKLADKVNAPSALLSSDPFGMYEQPTNSGDSSPPQSEDRFNTPEYLSEMKVINLNDTDNNTVTLVLPSGWKATRNEYEIDPSFSFLNPKNSAVKTLADFELFASDTIDETWTPSGLGLSSGTFGIRSYYRDQPENTIFNNHSSVVKRLYDGETILGKAQVYLMDCDIVDMLKTADETTYQMIYTWIPIENEDLAYCLEIPVPRHQDYEITFNQVMEILGAK